MIRVSCGTLSGGGREEVSLEYGLAGEVDAIFSRLEFADGEAGGLVLFCSSVGGESGGNLKSIGGNGFRPAGVRGKSRVFVGLFAADPGRPVLSRSLSALRFPGCRFIGDFGGRPRTGFRPARRKPSVETVSCNH